MRLDNGARDGQPHAHTFRLAGEERFEDLLQFAFGDTVATIQYRQVGKLLDARSPDTDDATSARRLPHRVDPVHDKIENDLLKLDAVAEDRKRISFDHANQFDLSSDSQHRKKFDAFPNEVV